tara:strand:- start:135 stop:536 length:402 start_codon:yes stop_codon:yes gene_type:complete
MLYPMAFMVLLTFIVAGIAIKHRFASVKNGTVSARFYKLMEGENVPEIITKSTRCFNNMFEVPVLFYVVCTLYISLNIDSSLAIVLAWSFVILRYLHAFIHLSYNYVLHRMLAFWFGLLAILGLWINIILLQS